jgi:hypothetical protein
MKQGWHTVSALPNAIKHDLCVSETGGVSYHVLPNLPLLKLLCFQNTHVGHLNVRSSFARSRFHEVGGGGHWVILTYRC